MKTRSLRAALAIGLVLVLVRIAGAAAPAPELAPVQFEKEKLSNGLDVIYAPVPTSPVVHVRVLYHVGSRDESPDRQGFAHMFEHMMFRGSAHVAPQEHMRMIMQVGGTSNAFTSFDQTTYWQTLPAANLELALYLEADRMASFKVSDEIFKTERKIVAEEWRMRYANQPYGPMYSDLLKTGYTTHPYRWTPIGDMEQLQQASSSELQTFFNRYYLPNNACLIIAGGIDTAKAKELVRKYFDWIPRGPEVTRTSLVEPDQTETRRLTVKRRSVPLASIVLAYKVPGRHSDDHLALGLLGAILTDGRSSRLNSILVNSEFPLCRSVDSGDLLLEDPTLFYLDMMALPDKPPEVIEQKVLEAIAEVAEKGISQEELDRARAKARMGIISSRELAADLAAQLGEEEVFGGDANRVNQEWDKLAALTTQDLQALAAKYLKTTDLTVLTYLPDPGAAPTSAPAVTETVAASSEPVTPRAVQFPADYPTKPPIAPVTLERQFEKGTETQVDGVRVIVMPDHRLPLVTWSLVMRAGGDAAPAAKEGLADITAAMMRRGAGKMNYLEISQDLESSGISLEASDDRDNTRISGDCTTDQLEHAFERMRQILFEPTFPATELEHLKLQATASLRQELTNPSVVASRELASAMFGDSPLGRQRSFPGIRSIQLKDVQDWYHAVYRPNDAILVIGGDVTPERGAELAAKLVADWQPAPSLPTADYTFPPATDKQRIILVDNPDGKQSVIRIGTRAYPLTSDEKFPGMVIGRIMSDGIHSRLDRYVRAEKGYTYGAAGFFSPTRHAGKFLASVDTRPETTGDCIEAMFKVFNDLRTENATPEELSEAQTRTTGMLLMEMQSVSQQTIRRIEGILNGYPVDYYDMYPKRVGEVTLEQARDVLSKYVRDDAMTIVVVAPAGEVHWQLQKLGAVELKDMPYKETLQPRKPATEEMIP